MDEKALKDQIHRYFVARYGSDYFYRAPETFDNVLERWMLAVASDNMDWADKLMTKIENWYYGKE